MAARLTDSLPKRSVLLTHSHSLRSGGERAIRAIGYWGESRGVEMAERVGLPPNAENRNEINGTTLLVEARVYQSCALKVQRQTLFKRSRRPSDIRTR